MDADARGQLTCTGSVHPPPAGGASGCPMSGELVLWHSSSCRIASHAVHRTEPRRVISKEDNSDEERNKKVERWSAVAPDVHQLHAHSPYSVK